jgi:hypothetical protein
MTAVGVVECAWLLSTDHLAYAITVVISSTVNAHVLTLICDLARCRTELLLLGGY